MLNPIGSDYGEEESKKSTCRSGGMGGGGTSENENPGLGRARSLWDTTSKGLF